MTMALSSMGLEGIVVGVRVTGLVSTEGENVWEITYLTTDPESASQALNELAQWTDREVQSRTSRVHDQMEKDQTDDPGP